MKNQSVCGDQCWGKMFQNCAPSFYSGESWGKICPKKLSTDLRINGRFVGDWWGVGVVQVYGGEYWNLVECEWPSLWIITALEHITLMQRRGESSAEGIWSSLIEKSIWAVELSTTDEQATMMKIMTTRFIVVTNCEQSTNGEQWAVGANLHQILSSRAQHRALHCIASLHCIKVTIRMQLLERYARGNLLVLLTGQNVLFDSLEPPKI